MNNIDQLYKQLDSSVLVTKAENIISNLSDRLEMIVVSRDIIASELSTGLLEEWDSEQCTAVEYLVRGNIDDPETGKTKVTQFLIRIEALLYSQYSPLFITFYRQDGSNIFTCCVYPIQSKSNQYNMLGRAITTSKLSSLSCDQASEYIIDYLGAIPINFAKLKVSEEVKQATRVKYSTFDEMSDAEKLLKATFDYCIDWLRTEGISIVYSDLTRNISAQVDNEDSTLYIELTKTCNSDDCDIIVTLRYNGVRDTINASKMKLDTSLPNAIYEVLGCRPALKRFKHKIKEMRLLNHSDGIYEYNSVLFTFKENTDTKRVFSCRFFQCNDGEADYICNVQGDAIPEGDILIRLDNICDIAQLERDLLDIAKKYSYTSGVDGKAGTPGMLDIDDA